LSSDYDTKFHILLGLNGQLITQSHRYSRYDITNKGLPEEIGSDKEWIEVPKLFLLNANINAYFDKYKLGINVYNLLNKEGFITASDTNLGLQRQEGRMFYLSLGYLF
jgi:outer membrane receptor protein involved in Fe transport